MSNLIQFDPNRESVKIRRPDRYCRHQKHVTVCEKTRTVECDDCGAVVDPFEFVLQWAQHGLSIETQFRQYEKDCKRLIKMIATLKRIEKNAKSRLSKHVRLPDSWAIEQFMEYRDWPLLEKIGIKKEKP